ncbi:MULTISPECIES: PIN domain-containing protein [unclassified Burkholderia]|uniref:PIN domain-containing protein n=1 Tax=unclassified Burkholderia TaxID=2613784 RepID=UPI00075F322B|nr:MULTISPECIES: type II toxin-antitoxin system VapC family toxin [unclassified Burkholderia]AOI75031.1 twitching motility protein PilT [Burkholderia sp. NRF60-BP8]KVA11603.1 twitching motility protein PilT [Burkholderia sp. NRF60-BP8]KVL18859.1 twitching motility protein PilT [Burkholderia sp. MSMB1826]
MPSLDTNILVRWLTNDDVDQVAHVRELFAASAGQADAFYIPVTVMLELEWVLRSRYKFDRQQILTALTALLETRELSFEAEGALERALHMYREHGGDFADCLHVGQASAASRAPLLTFDERAARLPGAEILGAGRAQLL